MGLSWSDFKDIKLLDKYSQEDINNFLNSKIDEFDAEKYGKFLLTQKGQEWFKSQNGQNWFKSFKGQEWFKSNKGDLWFKSKNGQEWFNSETGQIWFRSGWGQTFAKSDRFYRWIEWEKNGTEWFLSVEGQKWFCSDDGFEFFTTPSVQNYWWNTGETSFSQRWFCSESGIAWSNSIYFKKWLRTQSFVKTSTLDSRYSWFNNKSMEKIWCNSSNLNDLIPGYLLDKFWPTPYSENWFFGNKILVIIEWLKSTNGQIWMDSKVGNNWFASEYFTKWLYDNKEKEDINKAIHILKSKIFFILLKCDVGRNWLKNDGGLFMSKICNEILNSNEWYDWFNSVDGQNWFYSFNGIIWSKTIYCKNWLFSEDGKKWLMTKNGCEWLLSDKGKNWFNCSFGIEWFKNNRDYFFSYNFGKFYICQDGVNFILDEDFVEWILLISDDAWMHSDDAKIFLKKINIEYFSQLILQMILKNKVDNNFFKNKFEYFDKVVDCIFLKNIINSQYRRIFESELGKKLQKYPQFKIWLATSHGFEFLQTKEGIIWCQENIDWFSTSDGRRYLKYIGEKSKKDPTFYLTDFAKEIFDKNLEHLINNDFAVATITQ